MANRLIASLVAALAALAAAPAAHAKLAYVKGPNSGHPQVWTARDDGKAAHKIAAGTLPAISPDGRWIAWRDDDTVRLRKLAGHNVRRIGRSQAIGDVEFSPDS